MNKKILAIIPARGGSKTLPKKNIIELNGKPLISYTIKASLNSQYITKTLVSSDSDEILTIAKQYGADTIKGPLEFSTDEATSQNVIAHVLDSINELYDYIILLQPTSPLRDSQDIDSAFKLLFEKQATALISTYEVNNKILKTFIANEDCTIQGIANNKYPFMRRQDLPKTYMSNGAIYIINKDEFEKNNTFLTNKTISYVMAKEKSIDIDDQEDMLKVQRILQGDQKNEY